MLPAFRMGVAGIIGSGRQWMPWLSLDDAVAMIAHAMGDASMAGPVNAVAPGPVTNRDFTQALGRALGRPTFLPLPAFAARLALGEMADALLLASVRATPARLAAARYAWRHPDLDAALGAALADGG
jgi:NAD dependent epimerase/dehydratase family enzyme